MIDYELQYKTAYRARCTSKPWKEPPVGLVRAHIGRGVIKDRQRGYTIVPIVSYSKRDGKIVRELTKIYLRTPIAKGLRLRLIRRAPVAESE